VKRRRDGKVAKLLYKALALVFAVSAAVAAVAAVAVDLILGHVE